MSRTIRLRAIYRLPVETVLTITYEDEALRKSLERLSRVVQDLSEYQLKIGTPVSYAAKHQIGDGVPQRRFLGVSESDRQTIDRILEDRLANPPDSGKQVWAEIGEALVLSTNERFDEQIDPEGLPWKPNTPYTLRLKKAMGRSLMILQSSTRMRASINYQVVPS